jgi:hypothetical protein
MGKTGGRGKGEIRKARRNAAPSRHQRLSHTGMFALQSKRADTSEGRTERGGPSLLPPLIQAPNARSSRSERTAPLSVLPQYLRWRPIRPSANHACTFLNSDRVHLLRPQSPAISHTVGVGGDRTKTRVPAALLCTYQVSPLPSQSGYVPVASSGHGFTDPASAATVIFYVFIYACMCACM